MTCPRCQAQNRDSARFCRECGATFGAVCGACGATVEPGSKFCDGCGAPIGVAAATQPEPPRFVSPDLYTPQHIAEVVAFLCSDVASRITGAVIPLPGERPV